MKKLLLVTIFILFAANFSFAGGLGIQIGFFTPFSYTNSDAVDEGKFQVGNFNLYGFLPVAPLVKMGVQMGWQTLGEIKGSDEKIENKQVLLVADLNLQAISLNAGFGINNMSVASEDNTRFGPMLGVSYKMRGIPNISIPLTVQWHYLNMIGKEDKYGISEDSIYDWQFGIGIELSL